MRDGLVYHHAPSPFDAALDSLADARMPEEKKTVGSEKLRSCLSFQLSPQCKSLSLHPCKVGIAVHFSKHPALSVT